jgi:AmiR/NasT family two-component response regulator
LGARRRSTQRDAEPSVDAARASGRSTSGQNAENENLRAALTSRSIIDQAIGILMAQQQCSTEVAFELLRKASQGRNVKLRDVAAQIVSSVQRRSPGQRDGRY